MKYVLTIEIEADDQQAQDALDAAEGAVGVPVLSAARIRITNTYTVYGMDEERWEEDVVAASEEEAISEASRDGAVVAVLKEPLA